MGLSAQIWPTRFGARGRRGAVDNLSRRGARENLAWLRSRHGGNWSFFETDVRDAAAIDRIVGDLQPEHLAHLAGQVAMTTSLADPRLDFETNACGTFNVLEAVRLRSPDTSVYFSSTNKVYGSLESLRTVEVATRYVLPDFSQGLDESLPLDGSSPYGCSKLCAEQYCRDYFRMFGVRTVVFRHSSMYGGRQFATFDQGWIGWFCQQALEQAAGSARRSPSAATASKFATFCMPPISCKSISKPPTTSVQSPGESTTSAAA